MTNRYSHGIGCHPGPFDPSYINRACQRSGSLWEGSHKSSVVQADERLTSHPLCQSPGSAETGRLNSYRALFMAELDDEAISDIRLALTQIQPLGDERFAERIDTMLGVRRGKPKRGRMRGKANTPDGMEDQTGFGF